MVGSREPFKAYAQAVDQATASFAGPMQPSTAAMLHAANILGTAILCGLLAVADSISELEKETEH